MEKEVQFFDNPLHELLNDDRNDRIMMCRQSDYLEPLLLSAYPTDKIRRDLILACVDEGIASEMMVNPLAYENMYKYITRLMESHGCSRDWAREIIITWLHALQHISVVYIDRKRYVSYLFENAFPSVPVPEDETIRYKADPEPFVLMGVPADPHRFDDLDDLDDDSEDDDDYFEDEEDDDYAEEEDDDYEAEDQQESYPGKDKCEKLREIRRKIAEANGIDFQPAECTHKGPCRGTCPMCEKELEYLNEQLERKIESGETVNITGVAKDEVLEAGCVCDSPQEDQNYFKKGMDL